MKLLCVAFLLLAAIAMDRGFLLAGASKVQPSLTCRLTLEYVSHHKTNSDADPSSNTHLECSPVENGMVSDFSHIIDLPATFVQKNQDAIRKGNIFCNITGAVIASDGRVMLSTQSSVAVVDTPESFRRRRHLVSTVGTRSLLVLRISTNDATVSFSAQELYNFIFDISQPNVMPSLKSQYSALSIGKLNFIPTQYGVMEVSVNMNANGAGSSTIRDAAIVAVQSRYGVSSITSLADHVMFCIPPGTGSWSGVSSVNSWRTVLNDQWCGYISGTMHEMGHNLGLLHSNQGGIEYMDFTSYMSAGVGVPYYPIKSFNGANNWQLGWYSDRQITVDPLQGGKKITLATFVDHGKSNKANPVLIKVGNDTFLQYNRAKDFNYQTQSNIDQVTIVQQLSSSTSLLGGVDAKHPQFIINNFNGSGRNLWINVCSSGFGSATIPDWMVIAIGLDKSYCAVTTAPTLKPTRIRQRSPALH